MDADVAVQPVVDLGDSPLGDRRLVVFDGDTFEGRSVMPNFRTLERSTYGMPTRMVVADTPWLGGLDPADAEPATPPRR